VSAFDIHATQYSILNTQYSIHTIIQNPGDWKRKMEEPLTEQASFERLLQESRGRIVLTVLYLCALGLCFLIPVIYYFRLHCDERGARRMRALELEGIAQSLEHSEQNREETRAARRKYREERRARILQLFAPVRLVSFMSDVTMASWAAVTI
jgi:hypothetical protein